MTIPYRKRLGILRNPAIRAEIGALDAERDCERIVHLLACYEFPFDVTRSLELALFHTYGSRSVSRLLDVTGEFRLHGQKRYDDTRLLIAHFMQEGLDSPTGRRAIARMNGTHGRFRIPNDDFLFVLSTFVTYPVDWIGRWGWRPLTAHEKHAWFTFFRRVGERMGLAGVASTIKDMQAFVARYEAEHLVFAPSNRAVADATVAIFEDWFPWPLKAAVKPAVRALIPPVLTRAFGYEGGSRALGWLLDRAMRLRAACTRQLACEAYPKTIANTRNRTYPGNRYVIESLGPARLLQAEARTAGRPSGAGRAD
ncbi:MAG: oxygenase MpaB family protein [Burkholderiales bacterium]